MNVNVSFPLLLFCLVSGAGISEVPEAWQAWERSVRDGRIDRARGATTRKGWEKRLVEVFDRERFGQAVFFPLRGYGVNDVGGKAGEGYRPLGYDFLEGNEHRGHPAQDIFVRDRDRDGLDDDTGAPVDVLAVTDGVVLSVFSEWAGEGEGGLIRGGNYLWVYHPAQGVFSYYAHLREIFVHLGERVQGGQKIATLGRSGREACRARSPTHLHFMLLRCEGMQPMDPYRVLKDRSWVPVR